MDYGTDKVRGEISDMLAGYEPDDIAIVLLDGIEALIGNDPAYFANGRGNSLSHTLQMAANTVAAASK